MDTPDGFELDPDAIAAARVVVVDDEALVIASVRELLSITLDLEPRTFTDPEAALEHVQNEQVDVIISDFLMPKLDGVALLRAARACQPEVPRILLTGYADKENAIAAINEVRLFQYIEKPWEAAQLTAVITTAVNYVYAMRTLAAKLDELEKLEASLAGMRRTLIRAFA